MHISGLSKTRRDIFKWKNMFANLEQLKICAFANLNSVYINGNLLIHLETIYYVHSTMYYYVPLKNVILLFIKDALTKSF